MLRTLIRISVVLLILIISLYFYFLISADQKKVYIFKKVEGPQTASVLSKPPLPNIDKYKQGADSRLAILLTDSSATWMGLVNGLKVIGIPFIVTNDYQIALKHSVIFVYPALQPGSIPPEAIEKLALFPSQGGTLIAQSVTLPSLFKTFGFKTFLPAPKRLGRMVLNTKLPLTQGFNEPEEKTIHIGDNEEFTTAKIMYQQLSEAPLATYENGQAAIVQKNHQGGHAYALGFDLGQILSIAYDTRHTIANHFANHYEPYMDVLLHLLEKIYFQGQANALSLATVPQGKSLALIVTHDACFSEAIEGIPSYLAVELKHGVKATYFIQTKYVTDEGDRAFFIEKNFPLFQKLCDHHMELASHSVSHSLDFPKFILGTGKEAYPSYQPYIVGKVGPNRTIARGEIGDSKTYGGSILGELRVSRFLLQHFFPNNDTLSFRPGYLIQPYALPQTLYATHYKYSSSTTANESLTHLPYQLFYNRGYNQTTQRAQNIYEFPITVEDIIKPKLIERLPQSLELARKIARFGGLFILLIHPNVDASKVEFLDNFLKKVVTIGPLWTGTIAEFGAWWTARDQISLDVYKKTKNSVLVSIEAPLAIEGLTINIPAQFRLKSSLPKGIATKKDNTKFIIEQRIQGKVELEFDITPVYSQSQ